MPLRGIQQYIQNDPVAQEIGGMYSGAAQAVGNYAKNAWGGMSGMDRAAMVTSPIPIVGDAIGAAADIKHLYNDPSFLNAALAGLGLLPFVPSLGTIKSLDYAGHHRPATREGANTLDNLTDVYPQDIYTDNRAWQYYGHGDNPAMDKASVDIVKRFRNNPEATVKVYRAVPVGVDKINPGDWVTINRQYANQHGSSWVNDGKYRIIEAEVPAKSLTTSGDSIHEWGYFPD